MTDHDRSCLVTIVIPVAPGETAWRGLVRQIQKELSSTTPIVLASTDEPPLEIKALSKNYAIQWLRCRPGRAAQMNDAVDTVNSTYVWLLHADTTVSSGAFLALRRSLQGHRDALFYFRLRFTDGPALLRLNEWGVALRCRLFGLPFGDQGFCLRTETFKRLGRFNERAAYGEDHLLVWSARRAGVPLQQVPAILWTSGRKYGNHGWIRTTSRHIWLTLRQALPEALTCHRPCKVPRSPFS